MVIADVIWQYPGWCPDANVRAHHRELPTDNEARIPSAGGSFRDRAIHWLGLFRNKTIGLLKWDSRTHHRLQYNGTVLTFEGDTYASH
jgi:hypothetical protein